MQFFVEQLVSHLEFWCWLSLPCSSISVPLPQIIVFSLLLSNTESKIPLPTIFSVVMVLELLPWTDTSLVLLVQSWDLSVSELLASSGCSLPPTHHP